MANEQHCAHGLLPRQIELLRQILAPYAQAITKVDLFGSRASGQHRNNSDIDMVIHGCVSEKDIDRLHTLFQESALPFSVDVKSYEHTQYAPLKRHMDMTRRLLFTKDDLEERQESVPDGWESLPFPKAVTINPTVKLEKGKEYPFVEMKAVEPCWRDVSTREYRAFTSGGAKFECFDTLLARITPCLENGKTGQYLPEKYKISPAFGSTEFIVIRGKEGVTTSNFAYYIAKWGKFQNFAISQMSGSSGRQRVPAESLEKFYAPVPPLPEQRSIAHILGSLDDKIALNRCMNATLEGMAQALFKSWFVDFDPVIDKALAAGNPIPEPLQARAAVRESLGDARKPLLEDVQGLFPDAFEHTEEMGWIPKGWEVQPLYDIANFINGAAYRDFHFTEEASALPIVKIAEIKNGISGQTKFTKTALAEKYRIDDGEILFSWSGNPDTSIDTFVWTGGRGWLNQHIFKVDLYSPKDRNFVYYQLKSLRPTFAEIARNKQTTGLGHVTAQDMKRLFVIKCGEKMLEAFNHCIEHLFDKWYANLLETKKLADMRDTLLPKLLSGELRVADAEKFMENKT